MLTQSVMSSEPSPPALVKKAVSYSGGAVSRLSQAATAVNALIIFTSFFGLLGVGIFLNAAETLIRLRGARREPALA